MSQTPDSFRPSELDGADRRGADADLAASLATARTLEAARGSEAIAPSADFTDRVMRAVVLEPPPRPAGFLAALRTSPGLAGLIASVRDALAVVGAGPGLPMRARGLALAYVLAIAVIGTSLTGVAAYGAAGALGLLDGDASPTPTVQESTPPSTPPSPSPLPTLTPEPSVSPSPTPEPTETVEPSESTEPDESDEPEESDDHGGATPGASSGASPDASDDGDSSPEPSQGDDSSSEPSDTPRPSGTPKPSQTPN